MPPLLATSMMNVPVELAQHILSFCHPWDVAAFSKCSRSTYSLVYLSTDQHLWRQLFLDHAFDTPQVLADARRRIGIFNKASFDWKYELTNRLKAELTLLRGPATTTDQDHAVRMIITIIEESSLALWRTGSSRNITWLERTIRQSSLLNNLFCTSDADEPVQLYAQLRAYLSLTIDHIADKNTHVNHLERRDKSRAYVYDLRNYNAKNSWGPFLADGRVNWVHIEQLVNVVSLNIRELPGSWALTRPPSCLSATRPFAYSESVEPVVDWAGVEGTWRRYVCFMDYRDLYAFNFTDLADGPRHPKFFRDPRFREATRLIEVKLRIVAADDLRHYRLPEPSPNKYGLLQPLCFTGSSKGVNGNEASVEGYVIMEHDGVARWYFISIYDDHPQWSSNGVQIGGLGSAMGVVGIWTTTHHDQDDPVGPFWLWKVEVNSPTHLMEYT